MGDQEEIRELRKRIDDLLAELDVVDRRRQLAEQREANLRVALKNLLKDKDYRP